MDSWTLALVAAGIALVGVAAVVGTAIRAEGRLGLRSLVLPAAVLAAATAIAGIVAAEAARFSTFFAAAHLLYLVVAIAVPAAALAVLVAAAVRGATWPVWAVAAVLVLPAPVGWYATHVAPYRLRVERADVALPEERTGRDPVRVGVLSDLQTTRITSYEEEAVTRLLALDPDVILIPGDLFQGSQAELAEQLPAFRALLGRLQAPGGVYAVRGDTDKGDFLDQIVEGTDVEILDYRVVNVELGDRNLRIGGGALLWAHQTAVMSRRDLMASNPGTIRILVAHRPDVALALPPDSGVDLTVAGHTHGGQVALPLLGPVVTSSTVSRSVAAGGLHDVDGNELFVSTGVGLARLDAPQVRLFTRPAVGLVTLR
ncbi:MAG TPA: metallophosphoesterase [Acidimicrobiales bacterium]|nr:metallophosphoesterase [Acidimicrobiales bacterium]